MNLNKWAIKWGVPFEAVEDLRREFRVVSTDPVQSESTASEARVQTSIRLEASTVGARLWRNNVGAVETDDGRHIRYGLANDSKKMNTLIKSSDLIGLRPLLITRSHVGTTVGQFIAREVKPGAWSYSGTPREIAQLQFLELVTALGGDACFANRVGTL